MSATTTQAVVLTLPIPPSLNTLFSGKRRSQIRAKNTAKWEMKACTDAENGGKMRQEFTECGRRVVTTLPRDRTDRSRPMPQSTKWTPEQIEMLREAYRANAGLRTGWQRELSKAFGRTPNNVARKAQSLGLTSYKRTLPHLVDVPKAERNRARRPRKYATDEERRAAQSSQTRERLRTSGHPRGALGMKHTPEARAKMQAALQNWKKNLTPLERELVRVKSNKTKIERYGTAGPTFLLTENAYSRVKSGRREDLDNRFFRSAWEANYARYLNWLIAQKQIQGWEYEPDTFVFHGVTRNPLTYTPDFKVTENDSSIVYHEIKGWMDSKSKSKLKRMAKFYPDVSILVVGEDEYKALKKWSGMIEGWE